MLKFAQTKSKKKLEVGSKKKKKNLVLWKKYRNFAEQACFCDLLYIGEMQTLTRLANIFELKLKKKTITRTGEFHFVYESINSALIIKKLLKKKLSKENSRNFQHFVMLLSPLLRYFTKHLLSKIFSYICNRKVMQHSFSHFWMMT